MTEPRKGDERPPAPWGAFPLVELTVLAGLILLGIGVFGGNPTLIGVGVVLASLGGLEVSVREHFGGYRSHTTLLAGVAFFLVGAGTFYLGHQILAVALGAALAAFLLAFLWLRRAFQRASGGYSFKIGRMRG